MSRRDGLAELRIGLLAMAAVLACGATPLAGATADDGRRPYFAGEVVVSAEDEDDEPPGSADSLDAEEIEAAGARTVAEALELLPGVSTSIGSRNEQKVWVRGYEQANVLVLVDGVPASDPYYGDVDLSQLPVSDVARITVTRGAASALYGPGGLGGVISIVTYRGTGGRRLAGDVALADHDTAFVHGNAAGGGDRVDWYLGVGSETSDGFGVADGFAATEYEDGGRRVNSDLERRSLLARVGWRPGAVGSVVASLRVVDAEKGIPWSTVEPVGFTKFARFDEWRQVTLSVGYEHPLAAEGTLRAQLYGHLFDNVLDVYEGPELEELRLESAFDDTVLGAFLVGERALGDRHRLGASLHLRQDRHHAVETFPDGAAEAVGRYVARTAALALEDRVRLGDEVSLVASVSVENRDVREAESRRDGVLAEDPVADATVVSPQAQLRWRPAARWELSVAAYRRSRLPTLRELYGTQPPNPELDEQWARGVDLGVAWSPSPGVAVRADLFTDRVRELIVRERRDLPYENRDRAEIRGAELRVDAAVGPAVIGAGWTRLETELSGAVSDPDWIPWVPRDQGELLVRVRAGDRLGLDASWVYVGRRTDGRARLLGGFSMLGAGASVDIGAVELGVRVDNLLDADVSYEPGYPLAGRRVWLAARVVAGSATGDR